jgi:uncharacterized iron-regulated membrane protein
MKSETLKNALNAHGWVGLIISVPLFIVFWAGAITFFLPEMTQWAQLPYYVIDVDAKDNKQVLNYNALIEKQIDKYDVLPDERIILRLPNEKSPYLKMSFRVLSDPLPHDDKLTSQKETSGDSKEIKKEFKSLLIDPYTGIILSEHNQFELADFLYRLHYTLKLPQGKYIVGVITLFFLVIIITGVVVQLKNLIKNFFLYRKKQNTRSKMNDMHNVIGVISLPYAAMYAITGVILNLLVLLQIPSVLLLYNGDLIAVTEDAGSYTFRGDPSGKYAEMPDLAKYISELEQQNNAEVTRLIIHNYADSNAVIQVNGLYKTGFQRQLVRFYELATNSYPSNMNIHEDNTFSVGLRMLYSMHFADYAGTDMRLLYFVLAIAFCGMIIAGNVLWIIKRQGKNKHPKILAFTRGITLGGCLGVVTATAFAILLERILPEALNEREHFIQYAFGVVFLLLTCSGFFAKNLRPFIGYNLIASGVLVLMTIAYEWLVLGEVIVTLGNAGYQSIWYFSFGLLIISGLLLSVGIKVIKYGKLAEVEVCLLK